ncbi:hypothetical protein CCUS01_06680 [Colletotrichum cuscutae]|uniref:Uncharacterized protein n=1 Tax=Colletotrichum cuscutae TaxID=1209917 RepID=A0AAI9XYV7_9PEZI|nr:hypothetical protein CCUS01_06680 [Colletotrichum cuscutae]
MSGAYENNTRQPGLETSKHHQEHQIKRLGIGKSTSHADFHRNQRESQQSATNIASFLGLRLLLPLVHLAIASAITRDSQVIRKLDKTKLADTSESGLTSISVVLSGRSLLRGSQKPVSSASERLRGSIAWISLHLTSHLALMGGTRPACCKGQIICPWQGKVKSRVRKGERLRPRGHTHDTLKTKQVLRDWEAEKKEMVPMEFAEKKACFRAIEWAIHFDEDEKQARHGSEAEEKLARLVVSLRDITSTSFMPDEPRITVNDTNSGVPRDFTYRQSTEHNFGSYAKAVSNFLYHKLMSLSGFAVPVPSLDPSLPALNNNTRDSSMSSSPLDRELKIRCPLDAHPYPQLPARDSQKSKSIIRRLRNMASDFAMIWAYVGLEFIWRVRRFISHRLFWEKAEAQQLIRLPVSRSFSGVSIVVDRSDPYGKAADKLASSKQPATEICNISILTQRIQSPYGDDAAFHGTSCRLPTSFSERAKDIIFPIVCEAMKGSKAHPLLSTQKRNLRSSSVIIDSIYRVRIQSRKTDELASRDSKHIAGFLEE